MRFERGPQLSWLDEVVFDGVAGTQHLGGFEPWQRVNQLALRFRRQAHREAVDVNLLDVQAFRLEKELVTLAIRESASPCLRAKGSISARFLRSGRCRAAIRRCGSTNQLVHSIVRVHQVAGGLVDRRFGGREGERNRAPHRHVPRGTLRDSTPSSKSIDFRASRGGVPVFSRPHRNPKDFDGFGQIPRRRLIRTTSWTLFAAHVDQAVQKGPGRDHERLAAETAAVFELQAADLAAIEQNPPGPAENPLNVRLGLERGAHPLAVLAACPPGRAATTPPAHGCD